MVLTTLHSGGKYGQGGYKFSGGTHGVGAKCVNAVSEWFEVDIFAYMLMENHYHLQDESIMLIDTHVHLDQVEWVERVILLAVVRKIPEKMSIIPIK